MSSNKHNLLDEQKKQGSILYRCNFRPYIKSYEHPVVIHLRPITLQQNDVYTTWVKIIDITRFHRNYEVLWKER